MDTVDAPPTGSPLESEVENCLGRTLAWTASSRCCLQNARPSPELRRGSPRSLPGLGDPCLAPAFRCCPAPMPLRASLIGALSNLVLLLIPPWRSDSLHSPGSPKKPRGGKPLAPPGPWWRNKQGNASCSISIHLQPPPTRQGRPGHSIPEGNGIGGICQIGRSLRGGSMRERGTRLWLVPGPKTDLVVCGPCWWQTRPAGGCRPAMPAACWRAYRQHGAVARQMRPLKLRRTSDNLAGRGGRTPTGRSSFQLTRSAS